MKLDGFDPDFSVFRDEVVLTIKGNSEFKDLSNEWMQKSVDLKYSYQFEWLGVPIIQYPSDLAIFQEIVWNTKPDLIIECGVARGGSLVYWASMQEICGLSPNVVGVDIDIRDHAFDAIRNSRYSQEIKLIQGDSTSSEVAQAVQTHRKPMNKVMVVLDSNHTDEHVYKELELYSKLVTSNCYLLVLDTVIEDLEPDATKAWAPGSSPKTAVDRFMHGRSDFELDTHFESKASVTVAPGGIWKRKADK